MAKKTKVDAREVGRVMKGPEMQALIGRQTRAIAAAAGPGMVASVIVGRTRVRGSVITSTQEARENQARNQALTRAIDAGRV